MTQIEITLLAVAAVGTVFQWVLFGPRKVPLWLAYGAIVLASIIGYALTLDKPCPGTWDGVRACAVGFVAFALQLRGATGASKDAKIAPKTDSL